MLTEDNYVCAFKSSKNWPDLLSLYIPHITLIFISFFVFNKMRNVLNLYFEVINIMRQIALALESSNALLHYIKSLHV